MKQQQDKRDDPRIAIKMGYGRGRMILLYQTAIKGNEKPAGLSFREKSVGAWATKSGCE
jgi:hypothetical protein